MIFRRQIDTIYCLTRCKSARTITASDYFKLDTYKSCLSVLLLVLSNLTLSDAHAERIVDVTVISQTSSFGWIAQRISRKQDATSVLPGSRSLSRTIALMSSLACSCDNRREHQGSKGDGKIDIL